MKNKTIRFLGILYLGLLVFGTCQTQSAELTAVVKGQQYGTIEVFKIVFASDSLFKNPLKTIYFAYPSSKTGAVDFPYRAAFGGTPSAHMGCSQTANYPGGPAKLTFNDITLKKGSVRWVRIFYSKNSPENDSFSLYYDKVLLISFVPQNRDSWDDYYSADFKIKIP